MGVALFLFRFVPYLPLAIVFTDKDSFDPLRKDWLPAVYLARDRQVHWVYEQKGPWNKGKYLLPKIHEIFEQLNDSPDVFEMLRIFLEFCRHFTDWKETISELRLWSEEKFLCRAKIDKVKTFFFLLFLGTLAKEEISVLSNNRGGVIILSICTSAIDESSSQTTRNENFFKKPSFIFFCS